MSERIKGKVKFYNKNKGYGFISKDDGSGDTFVHASAIEEAGMITIVQDQRIEFEENIHRGKTQAGKLKAI